MISAQFESIQFDEYDQNRNIDVGLSEFPVGPVQGKKCWSFEIEQANSQLGNHISIQSDVFPEFIHLFS